MPDDAFLTIRDILVDVFECVDEQVVPQARLREDLRLDGYEVIEFADELESELGIPLDVAEISAVQTLQEVMDIVAREQGR
jgi:acyl carrier protein